MVRGGVIEPHRLPAVLETIERNAHLQEQLIERRPRRLSHHHRQASPGHSSGRSATGHPGSARDGRACRDGEGRQAASCNRAARRAGCRRFAAPPANRVEPAVERDQVHAARRARADPAVARQLSHRADGQRHRRGNRPGFSPPICSSGSARPTALSPAATAGSASASRSAVTWSKRMADASRR